MTSSGPREPITYRSVRGRWTLVVTILGSGLAFIEATAVNVALPAIGRDLGSDLADLQWVLSGYLVTLGSLVLVGGSLGDLYGKRRMFLAGIVAFAAASVLCGLAWSTTSLSIFRFVQGAAAALLVPNSLALIQAVFSPADRATAIGVWSGFSGVTSLLGPFLGGWLTQTVSWRGVFLVNPLIAVPTILLALRFVPETRRDPEARPDLAGAVSVTLALGALVLAFIEGPGRGWGDPLIVAAFAGALVAAAAFVGAELTSRQPMVPFSIFRSLQFTGANLYTLPVYGVLYGALVFLQLQLQNVLGYTPLAAGLATVPITLLLVVISPPAGQWATRIGPRVPMAAGSALAALGTGMLASVDQASTYLAGILPGVLVLGVGLGLLVAPLTATVLAAVSQRHVGLASGLNNAVARTAGLLAIVLIPLAAGFAGLQDLTGEAYSKGYAASMRISAGLLLVGSLIAMLTIREPLIEEDAPS